MTISRRAFFTGAAVAAPAVILTPSLLMPVRQIPISIEPLIYRGAGPWGEGLGEPLTAAQVDANFWRLWQMVNRIEAQVQLQARTTA